MRICAAYGEVPREPAEADMQEIRMDVFDSVPAWANDENTIVTMAGRVEIPIPEDFKGLVDVGDHDVHIRFRKIRSVHNFERTPTYVEMMFSLGSGDQWISKYAVMPKSFSDLHTIYRAANSCDRRHIVLGMGELGQITRIRQNALGNYLTFASAGKVTAKGQLTIEEMRKLGDDCKVVGIIGNPLGHTKSPAMQNAAMERAGVNGIYLKFESPTLDKAGDVIREYDIAGVNVTIPHKQGIMEHLDSVEKCAGDIGAVNTIINDGGKLIGTNTDYIGIQYAFGRAGRKLSDCSKVLVFGTGGAAMAAVYAAMDSGCETYVLGRTPEHVSEICRDFGCETGSRRIQDYDAVINCTPVGMGGDQPYMFDPKDLRSRQVVMDMVYNRKTQLVKAAESRKCQIVSGTEMLIGQGAESFRRWFGTEPDTDVMRKAVQ